MFLSFWVEDSPSLVNDGRAQAKKESCGRKDNAYWYADACGQSGDGSDLQTGYHRDHRSVAAWRRCCSTFESLR